MLRRSNSYLRYFRARRFFRVGFGPIYVLHFRRKKLCPTAKGLEVKKFIQDVCKSPRTQPRIGSLAVLDQATYQPKIERLMTPSVPSPVQKTPAKIGKSTEISFSELTA